MRKTREGSLDLLKFLATAVIVMHHYQQITRVIFKDHINFFNGDFYWGYLVELFFIISGYLAHRYVRCSEKQSFAGFWGKRYMRFLPLLVISGLGNIAYKAYDAALRGNAFPHNVWSCLAGLFGFSRWITEDVVLNNPTWYISVLLVCFAVFYLADYIAMKLKANPTGAFVGAMIVGLVMYQVCDSSAGFCLPLFSKSIGRGMICFFLGLLLYEAMDKARIHEKWPWVLGSAAYLAGFVWLFVKHRSYVDFGFYYLLVFTVFPAVLIVMKSKPIAWLCPGKFFSVLGNASYHAYMWHVAVIEITWMLFRKNRIPYNRPTSMYAFVAIAMLVGLASWGVFEAFSAVRRRIASNGKRVRG